MKNLRAQKGGPERSSRERFDEYRRRAYDIAQTLSLGEPVQATLETLSSLTGMSQSQVHEMKNLLIHVGSLKWRRAKHGIGEWTLIHPTDQMFAALEMEMERQMRGGKSIVTIRRQRATGVTRHSAEKVAVIEDRIGLPVGAVSGPERPNPMAPAAGYGRDAPAALVAAARLYRHGPDATVRKAQELVKELNEIGVSVPPELAAKATVRKDDRLEAVQLVLPYIDDLEKRLRAAQEQVKSMADYGQLRQRVEAQKRQIERLVAERTAQALGDPPPFTRPHN